MDGFIVITLITLGAMACIGLFMSGIAAMRQARLSKRMFKIRFRSDGGKLADDPDAS